MRQPLLAEPARLERVIAVRQARIGRAHRFDQRLHHFGLDPIRQMSSVGNVTETAPTVGDFLVLGEHIGDQRKRSQVLLERLGERLRGCLAHWRARILHEIERGLDRERLRADLETQAGDGLVEQAVPRRIAGHRLLVKELLDAVLELIGLVLADVFDPRPVVRQRPILHGGFELGVVEAIELEREEQEVRGGGGDALLHVGVEFRAGGIDGVAGVEEAGIGREAAEKIVERLVALHRRRELRSRLGSLDERRELALVGLLERQAFGGAAIEVARNLRIIDPGIEIGEVPFRQHAEAAWGTGLGRSLSDSAFCLCGHDRLRRSDDCGTSPETPMEGAWMMDMARDRRGSTGPREIAAAVTGRGSKSRAI